MKKIIIISVVIVLVILTIILTVRVNPYYGEDKSAPTPYLATPYFSDQVNESFVLSVARNIDLNSGITMENGKPLYSFQRNNITFAVFNHTDEEIIFSNQGFGLTIFRYDDITKTWANLQLRHVPYPEPVTLPSKLEKWDLDINNMWTILEVDAIELGYDQIRLYISGHGKNTNKTYGAYLDVTISTSP